MTHRDASQTTVTEAEVLQAARRFASALMDTPEYQELVEADCRLRRDGAAQAATEAFQERQRELGWQAQMGLLDQAQAKELERVRGAMLAQPAVQSFLEAQERLRQLAGELNDIISTAIGIDFAASCSRGCCG